MLIITLNNSRVPAPRPEPRGTDCCWEIQFWIIKFCQTLQLQSYSSCASQLLMLPQWDLLDSHIDNMTGLHTPTQRTVCWSVDNQCFHSD